jgi:hypothetical protein
MGVRLYDPSIGRFLSVDPVPGGNANAYDYVNGDPLNRYDLDGRWGWRKWARRATRLAVAGVFAVGIAAACRATAGIGCLAAAAIIGGAAASGADYWAQGTWGNKRRWRWRSFGKSVAWGAATSAVGFGAARYGGAARSWATRGWSCARSWWWRR